mgnify:CR=1 FL=1
MSDDNIFTYWKAGSGIRPGTIGGLCRVDDLPETAIIGHEDIPTDIDITIREDGETRVAIFTSPPVVGRKYAYRYRSVISDITRERLNGHVEPFLVNQEIRAEYMEAPHQDADRRNWWWSEKDRMWRSCNAPVRLIRKWRGAFIDLIARECGCENREDLVARHEEQVAAHKRSVRKNNDQAGKAKKYGPKNHGTIVVHSTPIAFKSNSVVQIFTLKPFGRRDQLGPHDHNTSRRYIIPHKPMQPVHPLWLEDIGAAGPIGYIALLAQREKDCREATSAHERVSARTRHAREIADWEQRSLAWLTETRAMLDSDDMPVNDLRMRARIVRAARKACRDYLWHLPDFGIDPIAVTLDVLDTDIVRALENTGNAARDNEPAP